MRALVAAVDRAFRELLSAVDTGLDAAAARMGISRTDLRCLEVLDREVFLPLVFDGMRLLDGFSTRSCDVLQIAVPR